MLILTLMSRVNHEEGAEVDMGLHVVLEVDLEVGIEDGVGVAEAEVGVGIEDITRMREVDMGVAVARGDGKTTTLEVVKTRGDGVLDEGCAFIGFNMSAIYEDMSRRLLGVSECHVLFYHGRDVPLYTTCNGNSFAFTRECTWIGLIYI